MSAVIIESQVDWLTCTSPAVEPDAPFNHWARNVLQVEVSAGNKRLPFTFKGYEGWHSGHASHGVRQDGSILLLSGDGAADRLDTALDLAANITRLDLAVTVRYGADRPQVEWDAYRQYQAWALGRVPKRKGSLTLGIQGGATFYAGARSSELYLRVYDKEAEQADDETAPKDGRYDGCHRWELEVKGNRTRMLADAVSMAMLPSHHIVQVVAHYCATHGIDHSAFSSAPMGLIPGFRRRSDVDTKLHWLAHSARPSVDWLRDHGHQARVLRALGYEGELGARLLALDKCREVEE